MVTIAILTVIGVALAGRLRVIRSDRLRLTRRLTTYASPR